MIKDNLVVGGLAFLLVISTIFNASNAEAIKQKEMLANISTPAILKMPEPMKILQKYEDV